jgi:hypothetical protein
MTLGRAVTWIGLIVGCVALLLQFALAVSLRLNNGDSIVGAVIFYFSFFTILTNLTLVFIYASELWPQSALGWFRSAVTRGMMAAAITLVMVFYHLILAETWEPQGLALVCDLALHCVTPILYVLWWAFFSRHGTLKFSDIPTMLVPPTIYLIYALVRGALTDEYPYPILEAGRIGYAAVALNVLFVLIGLIALCAIVVALDRLIVRVRLGSG